METIFIIILCILFGPLALFACVGGAYMMLYYFCFMPWCVIFKGVKRFVAKK